MPILAVVSIATTGEREVLAFRVGDRENQQAWEDLFDDLKARGVKEIGLWVSDGGQAMLSAIGAKFATMPRQRCVMRKMENVLSYVPQKQREQIEPERVSLFYQKGWKGADQAVAAFVEKYQKIYPTAVECLQRDLEACLTFYAFPKEQMARRFAPTMSSSGFLEKSSVVHTQWQPLFATKGVACYFSTPLFAVSSSTSSRRHRHPKSNQAPSFYTPLDILPFL
jgi:Transposase, Mutator family